LAWSKQRLTKTPSAVGDEDKLHRYRAGWAVGAGAEFALSSAWNARAEYLYTGFGSTAQSFPSGTRYTSSIDEQSIRIGINRQLG
jgi:high affinity Mn2+ porin